MQADTDSVALEVQEIILKLSTQKKKSKSKEKTEP